MFDYDVCMERDGGNAMWKEVGVVRVAGRHTRHCGIEWYPCVLADGEYRAAPDFDLRNLDPPKPERVRIKFRGDGSVAHATSLDCLPSEWDRDDLTHECNLADCYKPGLDLCSFKEMADAGVVISAHGRIYHVWTYDQSRYQWTRVYSERDYNEARRYASELTRGKR